MDQNNGAARPLPTSAIAGITPGWNKLRVVDADTGEAIKGVREVDTETGRVVRNDLDELGHLKIEDDRIVVIEETRRVRLEWANALTPAPATPPSDA